MLSLFFSTASDTADPPAPAYPQLPSSFPHFPTLFTTANINEASMLCFFSFLNLGIALSLQRLQEIETKCWRVEKHYIVLSLMTSEECLQISLEMTGCKLPHATRV